MSETINNETENTNFQLTWGSESTKSWFDITTDAYILVKRTIATIGWSCNKTISQKKKNEGVIFEYCAPFSDCTKKLIIPPSR